MENLRYLLAAIAALTLIMSVVSSVNPSYFAGLNAFADHEDEEDDDNSNSGTSNNHEEEEEDERENDESSDDEDERKLEQTLGNHSKAFLEVDEDAELEVEIEDGDLDDGTHDVVFACDRPNVNKEFTDSLNVTEGHGEFDTDLGLLNETYTGCEVKTGNLTAAFPTFTVIPDEHDDDDQDVEDDEEHEDDKEDNDKESSSGSNRHDDEEEDEEDDDNNSTGSQGEGSAEDKRKERKERIVSTTSGAEVHERHRNANPHSPGEYDPGWNYTLAANGTAMEATNNEEILQEANATVNLNISVWKSNRAIILLDVIDGTVEIEDQDYTVRVGYAFYSIQHDAMKVVALITDDDGNVLKLKLRGSAVDDTDSFPKESGSIDLTFGGHVQDWNLLLEGTVEAN